MKKKPYREQQKCLWGGPDWTDCSARRDEVKVNRGLWCQAVKRKMGTADGKLGFPGTTIGIWDSAPYVLAEEYVAL